MGSLLSVCLVRSIREDRTLVSSGNFILNVLGKEFTTPLSYPIDKIWEGSSNLEPILYLLSLGSDPTSSIEELARKKKEISIESCFYGRRLRCQSFCCHVRIFLNWRMGCIIKLPFGT